MMRALLFAFLLFSSSANATPLVADLSNYRIDIDSSFNGTRMFLFGARNEPGDVVVVIRGPLRNFMVRKKEEIGGLWINRDRMRFWNIPQFYAIAASRPLDEIEQETLFNQLAIGQSRVFHPPSNPQFRGRFNEFSTAFLTHQYTDRLYTQGTGQIQFMGDTLFKTTIEFPDNIPPGNYTAEIYLVEGGHVIGMHSTPISVVKTGLDEFLYRYAHEWPAFYGITAIIMALVAGWIAGRIFEKT